MGPWLIRSTTGSVWFTKHCPRQGILEVLMISSELLKVPAHIRSTRLSDKAYSTGTHMN